MDEKHALDWIREELKDAPEEPLVMRSDDPIPPNVHPATPVTYVDEHGIVCGGRLFVGSNDPRWFHKITFFSQRMYYLAYRDTARMRELVDQAFRLLFGEGDASIQELDAIQDAIDEEMGEG